MIITINIPKRGQKLTNGDIIKAVFKPYQIFIHTFHVNVYMREQDFECGNETQFDINWWNALHKQENGQEWTKAD